MKCYTLRHALSVCLLCLFSVNLFAAFDSAGTDPEPDTSTPATGIILGRVVDGDNEILPGAGVFIESLQTGVTADIDGYYKLPNLKPGTYDVTVSYVGYGSITEKVTVGAGKSEVHNFKLSEGRELAQVEVVGVFSGQRRALQLQKETMGITNVVSAEQTQKFPDSNIGDALKRINGVNVQYDQGEARFGQVRGTSADLTSVTVNGNRIPSAEGDTRNVQLDLIPSDMIQTIELNKVITSDMDGDAIGGEINLVTKSTPSRRILNFNVGTGYSWISKKMQWDLGATYGDRFFNNKLGVMAAVSYQYAPGGSDNTEFEYELNDDGEAEFKEAQIRQYYVTRERQSYSLALDYDFNELHKISFKGIYNRRSDWENRYRVSYKKLNSKVSKQSIVMQTKAGSSDNKDARLELQQTLDLSLGGEHHFGNLAADWMVSYSRATEDRPNERYASYTISGSDDEDYFESLEFANVGGKQPYAKVALPSLSNENWELDELTNQDEEIVENEWKARLNFELPLVKGLFGNTLKFGGKYTHKNKTKDITFYDYDPEEILGSSWRDLTGTQIRDGFMPGSEYPTGSYFISKSTLGDIDFSQYEGEENLEEEAGNYDVTEQVTAGYVRFDQKLGKQWAATVGLRLEHTALNTEGFIYNDVEETLTPTGEYKNNYTHLLPSLLVKYKINKEGNVRASITKTISRPKYSALVANKSYYLDDLEAEIGDPDTKPTQSWNFDLSADYYFKSVGLVSVGIFYKDLTDVNVECLSYQTGEAIGLSGDYAEEIFEVTQNLNAYDARIFGVEVAYQRDFGFIHPALKCVGFYGNYTYTHSSAHNLNSLLTEDGNTDGIEVAGSPEHTANASLYFDKWGVNVRLSYNYASSFLDELNTSSRELDRYYDHVNYLDLNASYTWGKQTTFTVYAAANNLLNQPLRYYQGHRSRTMQVEYYGVKVSAGIKINLF